MADFDSFSYDINSRLPEWWKNDALALPINKYTQELLSEILQSLLTTMGVVQPLNVWKSIPEEYDWYHHYVPLDDYLYYGEIPRSTCVLYGGDTVVAKLPNTKRKCHAKIRLRLKGGELEEVIDENDGRSHKELKESNPLVEELTIKNGSQLLKIYNVPKISTIEISTENNQILIDGEEGDYLIEGNLNKIEPTIKYADYQEPYIDGNNTLYKEIDIEDENKKTELIIKSSNTVNFDLEVYLLKPTYTTEQNIRIATVSAFPIEWVRLYGYFCHPFNNKQGYKFLWEKKYDINSRVTYDRITKQYDCERFYIQVKFHGLGTPLTKGFPQEEFDSNVAFQTNPNLDKWGKIYGIRRRVYRQDITEDEEPYTFPKYYNYPIEQDYWYEERMVNEYRFNDESINSLFVKDTDFNNVGRLECIYPFMDDIWVYTETVDPDSDIEQEKEFELCPDRKQDDDSVGVDWDGLNLIGTNIEKEPILLNPYNDEIIKRNDFSYQTKKFKCSFCLTPYEKQVPDDIKITGIELKFKSGMNLNSNSIRLSEDSKMILPFISKSFTNPYAKLSEEENASPTNNDIVLEKIDIGNELKFWDREKKYYTVGGQNYLFGQEKITKEQLFNDNDGKVEFEIRFINKSEFLEGRLILEDIKLKIYYEIIPDKYNLDVNFDKFTINKTIPDDSIDMTITMSNEGDKEIKDKEVYIIAAPELLIEGHQSYLFTLSSNPPETSSVTKKISLKDNVQTGLYDVLVCCEDKIISNEILVRSRQ